MAVCQFYADLEFTSSKITDYWRSKKEIAI